MCFMNNSGEQLTEYNEVRNAAEELSSKVKRIQSTLQRIAAPNMKAMEKLEMKGRNVHMQLVVWYVCRLDGVESRLQETSAEFEATRVLAKKTRSDFEIVKKQRY